MSQLVDEFRETGTLKQHLPAEVDIVHRVVDIYQDEKRWKQQRAERLASKATVIKIEAVKELAERIRDDGRRRTARQRFPLFHAMPVAEVWLLTDPLLDAPSIGSKTAARFTAIGIHTVGEFLSASGDTTWPVFCSPTGSPTRRSPSGNLRHG